MLSGFHHLLSSPYFHHVLNAFDRALGLNRTSIMNENTIPIFLVTPYPCLSPCWYHQFLDSNK